MGYEDEKRKHPRLPTAYITKYRLRDSGSDFAVGRTQNISQGGAFLFTDRMFYAGDQLEMNIQFPFSKELVRVIGEIVACTERRESSYETRLRFIEMDEDINKKLGELIERRRGTRDR